MRELNLCSKVNGKGLKLKRIGKKKLHRLNEHLPSGLKKLLETVNFLGMAAGLAETFL